MLTALDRLIDLVAEDNAIEDTIYHLARALDAERIDLDRFLKVSRHPCGLIIADGLAISKSGYLGVNNIRNER